MNDRFTIFLKENVVEVRRPKRHKLVWTWPDGIEYSLLCPRCTPFKRLWWHIGSADETICSGQMLHPSLFDTFVRAAFPYIRWKFHGEIIQDEPACCSGTLRLANGRRLAVWRQRRRFEAVCRDNNPNVPLPITLGMILARLFDPETPD
jgi:hypothetical protein